ncbi:MAG: SprT family zinc-dependent metalloprotease [Verrucomicrobiota bacterium]
MDFDPILVKVAGKVIEVWPKVSSRSNRVRLAVKPGPKIILSFPPHGSLASAKAFLKDNLPWLEKVVSRSRTVQTSLIDHLTKFSWLTLDERHLAVEIAPGTRASLKISKEDESVKLIVPEDDPEAGAVRALRRLAETGLSLAVARLSARVGVTVSQVSVRDQTTRWGSCSSSGTLSLNWRLILLPPMLHDHVILHELSHRKHMDHSPRFWNQLAAWDPEWEKHDQALTRRWNVIMDLGRA